MPASSLSESSYPFDLARRFPPQGQWSVGHYLRLTDQTRQLVELIDGRIEIPEMPSESHPLVVEVVSDAGHRH